MYYVFLTAECNDFVVACIFFILMIVCFSTFPQFLIIVKTYLILFNKCYKMYHIELSLKCSIFHHFDNVIFQIVFFAQIYSISTSISHSIGAYPDQCVWPFPFGDGVGVGGGVSFNIASGCIEIPVVFHAILYYYLNRHYLNTWSIQRHTFNNTQGKALKRTDTMYLFQSSVDLCFCLLYMTCIFSSEQPSTIHTQEVVDYSLL